MTKYRYSDTDFAEAIKSSISIRGALLKLGVAPHGGSYKTFHIRVKKLKIDTSHFLGEAHLKGKTNPHTKKISLEELLVSNSSRELNSSFKQRIIDAGLLKNECSKCEIKDTWQGEPIVLHIDHALTGLAYTGTIAGLVALLFALQHVPGADLAKQFFE